MKQQKGPGAGLWINGVRFLSHDEVASKLGISRPTIYNYIRARNFPRPVRVGRVFGWNEAAVDAWLAAELQRSELPAAPP